MKICVFGAGYVGLVSGVCLAELGHSVTIIEKNQERLESLGKGVPPFYEPDLERLIFKNSNRLSFRVDLSDISEFDLFLVCVGTPQSDNEDRASLEQVDAVFDEIIAAAGLHDFRGRGAINVFIKSTVPIGTNKRLRHKLDIYSEIFSCNLGSNPEFLREGCAINDFFYPDRIVLGGYEEELLSVGQQMYQPLNLNKAKIIVTDPTTSELVKYAANSLLATKLNFFNEVAHLSEAVGANIAQASLAVGLDQRIGKEFLKVGPGYGGSCFPKDTRALLSVAKEHGVNLSILDAVVRSNQVIRNRLTNLILNEIIDSRRRIAVLGIAFKADTDDLREAYSLELIPKLVEAGHEVFIYDPAYKSNEPPPGFKGCIFQESGKQALENADTVILLTEWKEFSTLSFDCAEKFKSTFDLRNLLTEEQMGFSERCYRIGSNDRIQLIEKGR